MSNELYENMIDWLKKDLDVRGDTFYDAYSAACQMACSIKMGTSNSAWYYICIGKLEAIKTMLHLLSGYTPQEWDRLINDCVLGSQRFDDFDEMRAKYHESGANLLYRGKLNNLILMLEKRAIAKHRAISVR